MRLPRYLVGASVAALMMGAATVGHAEEAEGPLSVTGLVSLTSDYTFRGVSQTDENPAIQGGLTLGHESGLFVGTWASSVDFDDADGASTEIDLIVGFSNEVGAMTYTVQALYYVYPDASEFEYEEFNVGLSFDTGTQFTPTVNVWYAPDLPGNLSSFYLTAGGSFAVTDTVRVFGNVGRTWLEGPGDFYDWNAGIAVTALGLTWDVRYVDTDINGNDLADERIVASVTKSF